MLRQESLRCWFLSLVPFSLLSPAITFESHDFLRLSVFSLSTPSCVSGTGAAPLPVSPLVTAGCRMKCRREVQAQREFAFALFRQVSCLFNV